MSSLYLLRRNNSQALCLTQDKVNSLEGRSGSTIRALLGLLYYTAFGIMKLRYEVNTHNLSSR